MTVTITSEVLGKAVGDPYTGPLEAWLLQEGYARADADSLTDPITLTPTPATLVGSTNAATLGVSGTVVFGTRTGALTTVALASGDTAAQAATKIDTALSGKADASIVSSKLNVVSVSTGPKAYVTVVSGTAAILTSLGLAVDQVAHGSEGRPVGASNTGAQAGLPAADLTSAVNREDPNWPLDEATNVSIANDAAHLNLVKNPAPGFDVDPGGVDDDAPSPAPATKLSPTTSLHTAAQVVTITSPDDNLQGVTSVTFGGTAGTALDVSKAADGVIKVTTPTSHAAGVVDVVLVDPSGNRTLTGAYTFS